MMPPAEAAMMYTVIYNPCLRLWLVDVKDEANNRGEDIKDDANTTEWIREGEGGGGMIKLVGERGLD